MAILEPKSRGAVSALFISSDETEFESLWSIFHDLAWTLQVAQTCRQAYSALSKFDFPVVLCETRLPDGNWKRILSNLAGSASQLVVSSRLADERDWIEAIECGAYDLVSTPFRRDEVSRVVRGAHLQWQIESEVCRQRQILGA